MIGVGVEGLGLRFKAGPVHGFDALIDLIVESCTIGLESDPMAIKVPLLDRTGPQVGDRTALRVHNFQSPYQALVVLHIGAGRVGRVPLADRRLESGQTLLFPQGLPMPASIGLLLAQGIKAFDQGSYKKTSTTTHDHGGMTSPQGLKQGQGFALKAPGAQMLGDRTIPYKKMGNTLLFSKRRSRRPHGHFTVTLPGIGR